MMREEGIEPYNNYGVGDRCRLYSRKAELSAIKLKVGHSR